MIASRLTARPTGPSTAMPSLSGPRSASARLISRRTAGSGLDPSSVIRPADPSTLRGSLGSPSHASGTTSPGRSVSRRARPGGSSRRASLVTTRQTVAMITRMYRRTDRSAMYSISWASLSAQVSSREIPGLCEAGDPRPDHQALPVLRVRSHKFQGRGGSDGAGADDAHVAPGYVPATAESHPDEWLSRPGPTGRDLRLGSNPLAPSRDRDRAAVPRLGPGF